jgi:hypothetical protein
MNREVVRAQEKQAIMFGKASAGFHAGLGISKGLYLAAGVWLPMRSQLAVHFRV